MKRAYVVGALALLQLVAPASAQENLPSAEQYSLRVEYLWWSPQPSGEIQKGLGDTLGTVLNVHEDLAVEGGSANDLRGVIRLGQAWKLRGSWTPLDFAGDALTTQPTGRYGTVTFQYGDRLVSSLKGNYFTGELAWDFLRRPSGFLGLLVGVKYFDVDTLVLNADTSERVVETQKLPVPVLGLAGRTYFSRLSLEAEFSGITAGSRGSVWELLFVLRVHVSDRLAGSGGYRWLKLRGEDERDLLELNLGAWTFGVEISL